MDPAAPATKSITFFACNVEDASLAPGSPVIRATAETFNVGVLEPNVLLKGECHRLDLAAAVLDDGRRQGANSTDPGAPDLGIRRHDRRRAMDRPVIARENHPVPLGESKPEYDSLRRSAGGRHDRAGSQQWCLPLDPLTEALSLGADEEVRMREPTDGDPACGPGRRRFDAHILEGNAESQGHHGMRGFMHAGPAIALAQFTLRSRMRGGAPAVEGRSGALVAPTGRPGRR